MVKPRIIILSRDTDTEGVAWLSDGWNTVSDRHTETAGLLMARARSAIFRAENVAGAITELENEGFEVVYDTELK